MKTLFSLSFILVAVVSRLSAYGPTGHEIVGGIADKLLANTPTAARVNTLIDGITLEKASLIADEIKEWDSAGPDAPNAFPDYSDHPKIDAQLRDFWRANPSAHTTYSAAPSHHWFHFTDVPVFKLESYSEGKVGRSKWDIVHMIPYCIAVLKGEIPENNSRKITKPVAVILLAHLVGDIHQPLHVGAEYFDESGRKADPDTHRHFLADDGGNTFALYLASGTSEAMARRDLKLHPFWDNEAVMANLPSLPSKISKEERSKEMEKAKQELINRLAHEEPANWRLPANVSLNDYPEAWADEILPIAREAHERLRFTNVHSQLDNGRVVVAGKVREKRTSDHVRYADWAAKIVREELHKAGWRLADVLNRALISTTAQPTQ